LAAHANGRPIFVCANIIGPTLSPVKIKSAIV
jgi:hypothetical protein